MRIQSATIRAKLPTANEYIDACRTNRYKAAKVKTQAEDIISSAVHDLIPIEGQCEIEFLWHEPNRRRDKDNVAFAKKFILDGLQKAKILPNDNNRYITGFRDRFSYDSNKPYMVTITIMETE